MLGETKESTVHMDHHENFKPFMSSANQTPVPLWCSTFFIEFFCVIPLWFSASHIQQTFRQTTHCDCPHSFNCSTSTYMASSNIQDIDCPTCCIRCVKKAIPSQTWTGTEGPEITPHGRDETIAKWRIQRDHTTKELAMKQFFPIIKDRLTTKIQ